MGRKIDGSSTDFQQFINSLDKKGHNYGLSTEQHRRTRRNESAPTQTDVTNLQNLGNSPIFSRDSARVRFAEKNDIKMGSWSNCNYLSVLAAFAGNNPVRLRDSISRTRNEDGTNTYTVNLFDKQPNGEFKRVKVAVHSSELRLDAAEVQNGKKRELWVNIIMTAVGKLNGNYNVSTGGSHQEAFEAFFGRTPQTFDLSTDSISFDELRSNLEQRKNIVIGSKSNVLEVRRNGFNIQPWHSYAVVGAYKNHNDREVVELYDPQGKTVRVPFDRLSASFNRLTIG
jgi:hypothetical protein